MLPKIVSRNRLLYIDFSQLTESALEITELTADMAIGTTLTVKNNNSFAVNQNLIIGEPGDEDAEFVKTHATSAVSGTTITLAATSIRAHGAGTKVYIVKYDAVELTFASTATGTKSVLVTSTGNGLVSLLADKKTQVYNELEKTSGFFFGRYVNDIGITFTADADTDTFTATAHGLQDGETVKVIAGTSLPTGLTTYTVYYIVGRAANTFQLATTSGGTAINITSAGSGTLTVYRSGLFSDAVTYGGMNQDTVAFIIDYALKRNSLDSFTKNITHEFCLEEINACLQFIQNKQIRWDDFQSLNTVLGQTTAGTFIYALQSDIYDSESNKSLITVRLARGENLTYKDHREFDDKNETMKYTQITTAASVADTTLNINNSYDFDDTGTVNVYSSGTKYSLTYTGVTRSATAGALTGVPASGTGSITVALAANLYVYQNIDEGEPLYYTVRGGNLEITPVPDGSWDNLNIFTDYWKVVTKVDSMADTIDNMRYELVKNWLVWKIRCQKENNGKLDYTDGDWLLFKEQLNDNIRNKGRGKKYATEPRVNRIRYRW